MEKENKIAITKGWCIFLAIVGIISLIGTPSLASMAERSSGQSTTTSIGSMVEKSSSQSDNIQSTTTGMGSMVEKSSSQSDNIQSTTTGMGSMVEKSSSQSDNIISDNHGIPPFDDPRGTLNVIPYGFQIFGSGTAGWTTEAFHTGSYSVKLTTTATGDYAAVSVNYHLALSGLDSISFWYKHTAYANYCGPRVSIGIDNNVNGVIDHLVISADVGQANVWTQRNLPIDDDRWWYGTYDPGTGVYTQEGGPITFATIKSLYPSADVLNMAFYMGVVGAGAGAGSVYIDDIAINSVAYYGSIQDTVDAASSGDTISVAAGTYDEQAVIGKSLTIQGAGDSTIIKPSSAAKLTQIFDGLFWYGGTKQIAGIVVANVPSGTSVTIKNLKVDESSVITKPTGADYLTGIFYRETGGCIDHVSIVGGGAWSGGDRAYGLYLSAATNTVTVEVKDSSITNFDKNGIEAMGATLSFSIHDSTITGRGPITDEVQNGVDVGRDAVGTVNYNTISNLAYQTEQWWAAGIMFYHYVLPTGKSATAIGNTITDCQIGIIFKNANGLAQDNTVSGAGLIGIYAEPNYAGTYTASFVGNTISVAKDDSYYHDENAAIGANTYDSLTPGTGASLTVTIHDNRLISASSTLADGISIGVGGAKGSIVATITNNIISNWQYGIRLTGALVNAASSNANFNSIAGNLIYGAYNGGTGTLDASGNWWGTNTPTGVAAIISGAVDYTPWLDVGTDMSGDPGFQGDFATLWVDDDSLQTGTTGRIQEGINLVSGSTVNVAAGTYDEQVVIDKTLTLQGAGDSTIIKPSSAAKLTQIFDGLFWYGGTKQIAGIVVANVPSGTSVTIKNLKVDESSVITKPTGADYLTGIFYRETGGCIDHVSIVGGGAWSGGDRAYGLYLSAATNTVTVEVKDSSITNFDKNGIEAMGATLSFSIHHDTITGRGPTLVGDEVQNGINAGRGSTGTVNNNMISDLAYQPETWWAAAILFCDSSGSANGNTITNCQIGIIYQDGGGSAQGNTINGGTVGLLGLWAQYTKSGTWTVSFSGNGVSGVRDSPPYENAAVGIQSWDSGAIITATIDNNQLTGGGSTSADGIYIGDIPANGPAGSITVAITNNIVSGWQHGINLVSSVTGATITGNTIQNNVAPGSGVHIVSGINAANIHVNFNTIAGNGGSGGYGVSNGGTGTLDAEYNYWGAASGPTHPGNPGGSGDPVSGNVDYYPWIDTNPPWYVTLNFQKLGDPLIKDTAVFGEKLDALDGQDVYDVPKPGIQPVPYIYAYFDAGLTEPYAKLWEDYRHFLHKEQTWTCKLQAQTDAHPSSTNVVISWDTAKINLSEYDYVGLYDGTTLLANMKTQSSYTISVLDDQIVVLTIKCQIGHTPVAIDDSYNARENTVLTIAAPGVLGNDTDVDGDPLTAVLDTGPPHGTLTLNSNGFFTYTPNPDYNGVDTFKYKAYDGIYYSNVATVTIQVIKRHELDIKTHWNLISIPYSEPIQKTSIIVRYSGNNYTWDQAVTNGYILSVLYDWDRTGQQYADPSSTTTLLPGRGYWCWAYYDCEFFIWSDAVDPTGHITDLKSKWNIMGLPYETPLPITDLLVVYNGNTYTWNQAVANQIILGFVYGWDRTTQVYTLETAFNPDYGYWMYAYHDCVLKKA